MIDSIANYGGLKIKDAREKIIEDFRNAGYLVKQEELEHEVQTHERCAREIIKMYHGEEFIKDAEDKYNAKANKTISDNIDTITFNGKLPITLIDLLFDLKIVDSKSEARRLIEQNGISVNGNKENDVNRIINEEDFKEGYIIIQKGKKVFLKVEIY